MLLMVNSAFPKKVKKKSKSNICLVVTEYLLEASMRLITQKAFLHGHRDLKIKWKELYFVRNLNLCILF